MGDLYPFKHAVVANFGTIDSATLSEVLLAVM